VESSGDWRDALPDMQTGAAARRADLNAQMDALCTGEHELSAKTIDRVWQGDIGGLYDWCASTFRFLLMTRELADELADLCRERGTRLCVEVGAGRGEMTAALVRRSIRCIATDDRSWEVRPRATSGMYGTHVRALGYVEALDALRPDTVICAWMPNHQDWTSAFRTAPSVQRYIVIGTGPGGATGTEQTWAEHPGWQRTPLPHLARYARCRLDTLLGTPYARLRTEVVLYTRLETIPGTDGSLKGRLASNPRQLT